MADRFLYSGVRQKIIDMMKMDLMGPSDEKEVLDENPKNAYITGILAPRSDATGISEPSSEQEVDSDIAYEDGANYTAGEDDDNEPITLSRFKMPSSMRFFKQCNKLGVKDFTVSLRFAKITFWSVFFTFSKKTRFPAHSVV